VSGDFDLSGQSGDVDLAVGTAAMAGGSGHDDDLADHVSADISAEDLKNGSAAAAARTTGGTADQSTMPTGQSTMPTGPSAVGAVRGQRSASPNPPRPAAAVGPAAPSTSTDLETRFGLVLGCLVACPSLALRKSRQVVPLFLEFLMLDLYALGGGGDDGGDDADQRELNLPAALCELAAAEAAPLRRRPGTSATAGAADLSPAGDGDERVEGDPSRTGDGRNGGSESAADRTGVGYPAAPRLFSHLLPRHGGGLGLDLDRDAADLQGDRSGAVLGAFAVAGASLPPRPAEVWGRLQRFLDVFVACGSPRQLVRHDLLQQVFIRCCARAPLEPRGRTATGHRGIEGRRP
jgi:hypothetical protein